MDFLIAVDTQIIPIEVKAGAIGSLRSLKIFLAERGLPFGVRISEAPLSLQDKVFSLPLYMIHELERLVKSSR